MLVSGRDADDAIGAEESSGSQWGKGLLEFTSSWSTSKKVMDFFVWRWRWRDCVR